MPFNSGTFTPQYNWTNEAAAGNPIDPTKFTAEENDIATGLSTCILKDGTQTVTADIPWGGKKLTNLGLATTSGDALSQAAGDARYQLVANKYKTAVTSRISTTTLTDDPELSSIALASGGVYAINCLMILDATTTSGMGYKSNLYFSSTLNNAGPHGIFYGNGGSVAGGGFVVQTVSGTASITSGSANTTAFGTQQYISVILITTGAGNLSVQWAQNSSTANNLNLRQGSYLQAMRIA